MQSAEWQHQIFQKIKSQLPAHLTLVDAVAGAMNISTDSAYRRIRGEKGLSFEEVVKLCTHFRISLDALLNLNTGAFLFQGDFVQPSTFQYDTYLHNIIQQVKYMSSFREKQMFQLCKDIPIFHHFHLKPIAAFKHYFWMKTILQHPDFRTKKFSLKDYSDELFQLGRTALQYHNQLESVEIWTIETINSTIRQVEFYRDMDMFTVKDDIYEIYEALEALLLHLEKQALNGHKSPYGETESEGMGSYRLYYNEVILGDNSILTVLDGQKAAFLIHSVINFMITRDIRFCDNTYDNIQNLIKKSTLISEVSERERMLFFKYLRNRISGGSER